jgi:hypothetical protein
MTITLSGVRVYTQDRTSPDSVGYTGPNNTLSNKDELILSRVYPKPVGTFGGMARPGGKLVRRVALNGGTTDYALASLSLSGALPAGIASGDVDLLIADFSALLVLEVADTIKWIQNLKLNY